MERMLRNRKAFYQKQNDVHHGNTTKNQPHNHKQASKPLSIINIEKHSEYKTKSLSESYCDIYHKEILQQSTCQKHKSLFLANHKIDASLRARMIDWMIEVTTSYKFSDKTFFDSVDLMDSYFEKETTSLPIDKLHILGVSSMIIASKVNQISSLKIRTVYEKIAHRKLAVNDIVSNEAKIIQKLGYRLNSFTFYDVICLRLTTMYYNRQQLVLQDIVNSSQAEPFEKKQQLNRLLAVCTFLSRFVLFDYPFFCQNSNLLLAQATIMLALEICGTKMYHMQFQNSKQDIYTCRLQHLNIIKYFKQNYKNLNNIFKFTEPYVVKMLQKFIN